LLCFSPQAEFEAAAAEAKTLQNVSQADMADLYKYFKQATVGDINIGSSPSITSASKYDSCNKIECCEFLFADRPGMFSMDFTAKGKWDAWNSVKGTHNITYLTCFVVFFVCMLIPTVLCAGMSQDDARKNYIAKVASLKQ
jgi:acyl-CoA-binding protein